MHWRDKIYLISSMELNAFIPQTNMYLYVSMGCYGT